MGKSLREQLLEAGLVAPKASPARGSNKVPRARQEQRDRGAPPIRESAKPAPEKTNAKSSVKARQALRHSVRRLVRSQQLNEKDAEVAYHFVVGKLIKRLYVTPEQHRRLCAGELAIAVVGERNYLISLPTAEQLLALDPNAVVVRATPEADSAEDGSEGVPDDLLW